MANPIYVTLTSLGRRSGVGRGVVTRLVLQGEIVPDARLDFNDALQPVFLSTQIEKVRQIAQRGEHPGEPTAA